METGSLTSGLLGGLIGMLAGVISISIGVFIARLIGAHLDKREEKRAAARIAKLDAEYQKAKEDAAALSEKLPELPEWLIAENWVPILCALEERVYYGLSFYLMMFNGWIVSISFEILVPASPRTIVRLHGSSVTWQFEGAEKYEMHIKNAYYQLKDKADVITTELTKQREQSLKGEPCTPK